MNTLQQLIDPALSQPWKPQVQEPVSDSAYMQSPPGNAAATPTVTDLDDNDYGTDLGASHRFAEVNADKLRFVPGLGWHCWDGKRWGRDTMGRALEQSKECARSWVLKWIGSDAKDREARVKSALTLEGASHIRAAMDLAQSSPPLVMPHSQLDVNPWMLNVTNGTLDLLTGKLRPHSKGDFITKLAPVAFNPEASHPVVTEVMATIDATCPGMSGFLSRCFGAALTGDASPESLFLVQGDGGSGKTTLSEGVAAMLGDYAVKLPFESFCLSRFGRSPGAASPDLVQLRGARFAYASEGDASAKLDAGQVKTLTGGEPLTCRALYSEPITFPQTWKLWLVSNFDPRADSDDTGLWRRLLKIHFHVVPPERRNPRVKSALCGDPAAQSALLAWAVRGCLDWQQRGGGRTGLAALLEVETATNEYRRKQDALGQWYEELLAKGAVKDPTGVVKTGDLRSSYEDWCEENGTTACYGQRFAAFLERNGLVKGFQNGGVRVWKGLRLMGQ